MMITNTERIKQLAAERALVYNRLLLDYYLNAERYGIGLDKKHIPEPVMNVAVKYVATELFHAANQLI